ncbi:MAG: CarD family transcriptional regulator [Terriglobia bacterium]
MDFRIGDKVVYPNQGVGVVEQISNRNLTGRPETFYLLKLSSSGMRVMVPMTNVAEVGLRRVARVREVATVLEFLNTAPANRLADWKGRFKQNSEKMRNGTLQQVAEVFKALAVLSQEKPLSFREKKMLDRSWQLLVDEISVARGTSRTAAESELLSLLDKTHLKAPLPS